VSLRAQALVHRLGGGRPLLDGVDVHVEPGHCHALLGANGAGKSQLIALLAGDHLPAAGQITLDGLELSRWTPAALARRRAVFSQTDPLRFPFCAREVVALGRLPHGGSAADNDAVVEQALGWVEMTDAANRNYLALSGGERARLRLARTLAQLLPPPSSSAGYLLLDEPLAHFDAGFRLRILHRLRTLARQGYGVLLALHEPELALDWADRVTLLVGGRVAFSGSPSALDATQLSRAYGVEMRLVEAPRLTLAAPPCSGSGSW
jgi:ABC-type hemin transport system, ATPase component